VGIELLVPLSIHKWRILVPTRNEGKLALRIGRQHRPAGAEDHAAVLLRFSYILEGAEIACDRGGELAAAAALNLQLHHVIFGRPRGGAPPTGCPQRVRAPCPVALGDSALQARLPAPICSAHQRMLSPMIISRRMSPYETDVRWLERNLHGNFTDAISNAICHGSKTVTMRTHGRSSPARRRHEFSDISRNDAVSDAFADHLDPVQEPAGGEGRRSPGRIAEADCTISR
jgi:hypothetical protein